MGIAGGTFIGPPWTGAREDKHTVRRSFCAVWGDASIDATDRGAGDERTVHTICRYKRAGGTLQVFTHGNTLAANALASIKKGEKFIAFGIRTDSLIGGRNGNKWTSSMTAHIVCKAGMLAMLSDLYDLHRDMGDMGLPRFLRALWDTQDVRQTAIERDEQREQPDVWESGE